MQAEIFGHWALSEDRFKFPVPDAGDWDGDVDAFMYAHLGLGVRLLFAHGVHASDLRQDHTSVSYSHGGKLTRC